MIALGLGRPVLRERLTAREYQDLLAVVGQNAWTMDRDDREDRARFLREWVAEIEEEVNG